LWGDLAKLARKSGEWEVAMVAASFCVEHNAEDKAKGEEYNIPPRNAIP
jgi:hypothetical protein